MNQEGNGAPAEKQEAFSSSASAKAEKAPSFLFVRKSRKFFMDDLHLLETRMSV
jgi:hypothetical protein